MLKGLISHFKDTEIYKSKSIILDHFFLSIFFFNINMSPLLTYFFISLSGYNLLNTVSQVYHGYCEVFFNKKTYIFVLPYKYSRIPL